MLHTRTDSGALEEVTRLEVAAFAPLLEPPVLYGGQLYLPIPLHLREPALVHAHYLLAAAWDLEFDQFAERLYSPAEADDLVERVRMPLDQLVQAIDEVEGDEKRGIGREVVDDPRVVKALGGTRQILALLRQSGEDAFLEAAAKDCRSCSCCQEVPCGACQAGGVCDALACRREARELAEDHEGDTESDELAEEAPEA